MMKIFVKNKKLFTTLIIIFLLMFSICFLVTQPLFFDYKFSTNFISSAFSSVDEIILKNHVKFLSENNRTSEDGQEKVVNYILEELKKNNIDEKNIETQKYMINEREYKNIIVHFKADSTTKEPQHNKKYIIGAHYDSYASLPGADDNASAIAGLLEISRILGEIGYMGNKEIDLVFYSTEEPPFFATEHMGSFQHAKTLNNEEIELVIVLEMIGYFSEKKESQQFPLAFLRYFYPTEGNFIMVVSNLSNSFKTRQVKRWINAFLGKNDIVGVVSINSPEIIPGIGFSDHRNYWRFNIPTVMITDTAFYRNKNYHTQNDTYEKLDYKKMKEVVDATIATVLSL